jgi:chitodextrinase
MSPRRVTVQSLVVGLVGGTLALGAAPGPAAGIDAATDTTPPLVLIWSGPEGRTSDATPSYVFLADEPSSFECRVVPAGAVVPAFGPCSGSGDGQVPGDGQIPGGMHSPAADLADGRYTFEVRATDPSGNSSSVARALEVTAAACATGQWQISTAQTAITAATGTLTTTKAALAQARRQLRKAKKQLRAALASGSAGDVTRARARVKKATAKVRRARTQVTAAEAALASAETDFVAAQAAVNTACV